MADINTYEEFVRYAKSCKCTALLKEVNTYNNDWPLPVLYAEAYGKLVGTWSPKQLGHTIAVSPNWSKKGRTFERIKI